MVQETAENMEEWNRQDYFTYILLWIEKNWSEPKNNEVAYEISSSNPESDPSTYRAKAT